MKTSIPKLHSIRLKSGLFAENVVTTEKFEPEGDISALQVLEAAIMANLRSVVLIGYDQDDNEYIAGTYVDPKQTAYLFGRGQLDMLRRGDADE